MAFYANSTDEDRYLVELEDVGDGCVNVLVDGTAVLTFEEDGSISLFGDDQEESRLLLDKAGYPKINKM